MTPNDERRAAYMVEEIHIASARVWLAKRYKRHNVQELMSYAGYLRIRAFDWYGVWGC